jgi:hypothetical protein
MGLKARKIQVGDLVAVYEETGYWDREKKDKRGDSVWNSTGKDAAFSIVREIRSVGDVPHTGEPEACIHVSCRSLSGECGPAQRAWVCLSDVALIMPAHRLKGKLK